MQRLFDVRNGKTEFEGLSKILNQKANLALFYASFIDAYVLHMKTYPSSKYQREEGYYEWTIPIKSLQSEINQSARRTGHHFDHKHVSQFINFLCAMRLLVKSQDRKKESAQRYYIPIIDDEYLAIWNNRCQQVYEKKVLSMRMSSSSVARAGIYGLLEDIYPTCNTRNRAQAKVQQDEEFNNLIDLIDEQIEDMGYCTYDSLYRAWIETAPYYRAISRPKAFFQQLWTDRKPIIKKRYRYKPPTRAQANCFHLKDRKWIILPFRPSPIEVIYSLLDKEDEARRLTNGALGQIMSIKDNLIVSRSGRLFSETPSGKADEHKPAIINGRQCYVHHFQKNQQKTVPIYKLLMLAFGSLDQCSMLARRDIYRADDRWKAFCSLHVHHIDGNRDNNDISNLQLLTPEEHEQLHRSPPAAEA